MTISNAASEHPAFERIRSQPIESLNLTVEEYRHRKTGAIHYHLAADLDENVFLVALRTAPMDNSGVAHILEHTALCGSKRYPLRDPFFMMIRRSLNTFMNAFTSSDWTAYPFASQNRKDFDNLLDVYLDAVFFCNLNESDFSQEGHRLEFAEPENSESELVYKGVVFNEMKGAMSSVNSQLWHTFSKYMYPTTTYHYNSGGEPAKIPELTHQQLVAFHQRNYHPSNAIFMTFGDIPAAEHHAVFEDRVLSQFERSENLISVPDEQRYLAPLTVEEHYPISKEEGSENKTHVVMGWLLGRSTDLEAQLKAHLLSGVLLDDGASPLRQALESSDLGTSPSPMCGLEDSSKEMVFMCGLEGSNPEQAEAIQELILGVLQKVSEDGVPVERVEAVLHQLELHQREIGGDSHPYGLQLILQALSAGTHRGDPVAVLNLEPVLESLREQIKAPNFVQNLVRKFLLENQHRVRLSLKPDSEISAREAAAEKARLAQQKKELTEQDKQEILLRTKVLAKRQEEEEDPSLLPKVGLEDVPADLKVAEARAGKINGAKASYYSQGTNGIVYHQVIAELPQLSQQQVQVLNQFGHCFTELGSGDRDYLQTQILQSSVSGGVSAAASVRTTIQDPNAVRGNFILSGKALARNQAKLGELLQETFTAVRFDETDRMREIIAQEKAARENSVTGNGHGLAMLAAASSLSTGAGIAHRWQGLAGIKALKALDKRIKDDAEAKALAAEFAAMHKAITQAPREFLIIGEAENTAAAESSLNKLWKNQDSNTFEAMQFASASLPGRQLWIANTTVNFCAKAYRTVPVEHADSPVLSVLGVFLRNGFLHRVIREQGGAYGGGAGHDNDNGIFRFYSYRDPRLEETLADYDRSIEWLLGSNHEWRLVEEAILGVVGSLDKPASPSGEARKAFYSQLYGRTPGVRRRFREGVLAVTLKDLQRVAETYLKPADACVAVLTGAASSGKAAELEMEVFQL